MAIVLESAALYLAAWIISVRLDQGEWPVVR
jgi:hypothetical protein